MKYLYNNKLKPCTLVEYWLGVTFWLLIGLMLGFFLAQWLIIQTIEAGV